MPKADVESALTDMLSNAEGLLEGRHASHRTARKRIEMLFEQLEISWTVKIAEVSVDTTGIVVSDTTESPVPLSWKHPTVGWLADWNHFQPLKLPKMKVPGGKGNGVYDSPEEYFKSTLKLWVGMTFVDGNNALLPHCTVKGAGDKVCDQPIWPISSNGPSGGGALRFTCRSSRCTRNVEFMCANRNHDRGLCRLCASQRQELLRGPPSTHASTHIYDGSVTSVQYDGTIYVENFESRKPPMGNVHWKTTKRLACPNLVGIVLLESRGGSLRLTDGIYWARVALHGDSRDEFREREKGKVALSLLNYSSDNSPNPLLDQNIPKGAAVAIIDCQTFVPEFIPVLTALERQSEMPMPFESGALLNLRKRASIALPEIATLFESANGIDGLPSLPSIDSDDDDDDDDEIPVISMSRAHAKLKRLIEELVSESTLDPIVQIRRDEQLRDQLQFRLFLLVQMATLDNGQLESFLAALRFPVHCTQGPPGTGKSYLGVVVVRALLIIRKLWMTVSDSVGAPPILVLSYKNHAIDEFLLDLVRKEPSMNHRTNPRTMFGYPTYRPLVRIGGGCNEPELFPYQEYNASRKSAQVQLLAAQIGDLHALQDKVHRIRDRFTVIKESQFVMLDKSQSDHDDERKKRDKKVCHDAAVELKQVGGAIMACMKALDAPEHDDTDNDGTLNDDTDDDGTPNDDTDGDGTPNDDAEDKSQRLLKTLEDVIVSGASPLTRDNIPLLYDGIRHYDPSMDPAEILHRWISGFMPMPSCAATYCEGISDGESAFCSNHRCHFLFGDLEGARCEDVIVENRKFCASHVCSSNHCKRSRASEKQLYCSDHMCFVCLADASVDIAGEATEKPPRNACELHPLCWNCDSSGFCSNLVVPGDSYCEVHAQLGCHAVKKDGTPCKGLVISRSVQYCYDHRAQHIDKTEPRYAEAPIQDSAGSSKCHSLNAKGKPCGSRPRPGSKYCSAHLSKANADVTKKDSANSIEVIESGSADNDGSDQAAGSTFASPGSQDGGEVDGTRVSITKDSTIEVKANKVDPADAVDNDEESEMFSCSSGSEADFDADTFDFDNYDEVEESEHLQHLREVDEVADVVKEDSNSSDDEEEKQDEDGLFEFEFELTSSAVDGVAATAIWSWEMPLTTRWACVTALLNQWGPVSHLLLQTLKHAISAAKKQMYFEELKQKARAFEGKAVIGGTITGCVARLEAIRATNPFAILVEEASEVLEPLLFSCLCSSTCKLEMIGDHLQLQPSVMSKFDFERVNNINISMFERLIRSPPSNLVPASVLSIQRRMRRDICDLTREFYVGITEIEDHEICLTKTIQAPVIRKQWKAFVSSPTPNLLPYSEGKGREVPGVAPHLFFWEHSGAEERARVGLSRINPSEAEMACSLAKYLVTCGVPPTSIAILTPYKGQLMFMRDLLMRKYKLVKFTQQTTGPQTGQQKPSPSCVLSTVDRFQGDEADVVIISLVIDGKSRTPFVKLQNRMIVLLSRARIGMYVIGNTTYFGETLHWKSTFDLLRANAASDNAPEVDEECRAFEGPRIGTKLPLCCPQHRESTALVSNPADLKLSFCKVVCEKTLPCSHECGLRCHWPHVKNHNQFCKVPIESPCVNHPRSMACSYFCTATGRSDIDVALQIYRCDADEVLELPCSHEHTLKCAAKADILSGNRSYPACTEKAIAPYLYPTCKHLKDCSCVDFYRFTAGRAPPCEKDEEYFASCGHRVILQCYRRTEIMADPSKFVCKERVTARLPRCGHNATVACPVVKTFDVWTGAALSTYGVVDEGFSYGSKDYSCAEMVTFRRKCGHEEEMKCEQAFDIARASPPCRKVVSFVNPECGHTHQTTCFEAAKFNDIISRALDEDEIAKTPLTHISESERGAQFRNIGLGIRCSTPVMLTRKCQHSEQVTCNIARHLTTTCKEIVVVTNPCCGHQIRIPCEHTETLNQWQPWSAALYEGGEAAKKSVALLHESSVLEDTLSPPLSLPAALASLLKKCGNSLLLRRATSCGHELRMKCGTAMKLLSPDAKSKVPPCLEQVTKARVPCGHEIQVPCSRDISSMRCNLMTDKQCWNFGQCEATVQATCSTSNDLVQCSNKTTWKCGQGHSFQIQQCKQGIPAQCPSCSRVSLEAEITATAEMLSNPESLEWPPCEAVAFILPLASANCKSIRMGLDQQRDFLMRKLKLLEQFKRSIDKTKDIWSRPVFQPKLIPIFAVRSKKNLRTASDIKSFEMKDFGNANSQGIQVKEATQANVIALLSQVKKASTHAVFGVAYSLGICTDTTGFPKNGKNAAGAQAIWISNQRDKFGFDALLIQAPGAHKSSSADAEQGKLTLWDPFAAFPTHEVVLSANNLVSSTLVDRFPTASSWRASSRFVAFTRPWTQAAHSNKESGKPEYLNRLQPLLVAEFPWASGIQVNQSWDGKALCIADTVLPVAIERELHEKLSFVTAVSGSSASASQKAKASGSRPFAGIKYLGKIVKQQPLQEADLLLSLEQLAIQKANSSSAETKLNAYVSTTTSSPSGYCHPLVLVAFARLASRKKDPCVQPTEFLKIFRELYPDAGDYWFSPDERALFDSKDQKSPQADAGTKRSPDDMSFEERWILMKRQDGCKSDAMDELLKMVGLRRVKDSALKLFKSALALSKMEAAKRKKNAPAMNYCFMGNPGTGKTTVARLFARILNDSGMRRSKNAVMCGAQEVKDDGPVEFRKKITGAMGGVIFIDEAYELDPMGDSKGKPIVAELLTAAEDKRDDLSIILAGYEDDIQQKLYRYNDGIKSRFEEIHFDDFDEADLKVVWDGLLAEKEWASEDKCGVIACRRLARGTGVKGFGNARAVRQLFEKSTQAAMAREDFNGITEIRTVDVLGERPTKNPKLRAVLKELSSKIGWRAIKDKVVELVKICDKNYERELNGVDTIPVSMNRLFLGNPGTGKTTCAAIYGRVLKCLNFLSIGDVVKKTAGDFVGQYVGQSQTKTVDILKMAKGKVLVIDEAYNLDDNLYGKQVLDVLVEKVQGNESDDIAVILIGYEQQMLEMLRTQNPGLARRFPQQYAFYFDDYSEQELLDIFLAACAKKSVHCPLEVSELVIRQLSLQKSQANFGNAGAVELILKNAIANASARPLDGDTITLAVEDVEDDVMRRARLESAKESAGHDAGQENDPLAVLNGLYRVEHIKDKLRQIQTSIQVAQDEGSDIPKIGHFVFRGSPGTGKTTVARAVAKIFHRMGILATDKLVETSGLNLTGEYVGQTKKRVEDQLGQARGGVLFIDEAYELGKGHFGEEAMTSLVAAMTNPMYAGMVIIIAGYPRDLDEMLDRNAGLKSRFTRYVDFYDWETDDCVEFTLATSNREGYTLSQDALECVRRTFDALRALPMFGNGRDVMQLWGEMIDCRAQRVKGNPELVKTLTLTDAEAAAHSVLAGRKPATGAAMRQSSFKALNDPPLALDSSFGNAPRQNVNTSVDEAKEELDDEKEEEVVNRWSRIARDEGVEDDTWAELERAKRDYDEMLRALQDERDKKAQDDAKDKLKKFVAVQEKLRRLSKCPMGFVWLQVGGGWRCAGGTHFVSDGELERNFMH